MNIVVFGATGMVGGSVIKALLKSSQKIKVKAVTRTPTSDASRQLAEDGVIIATADLNDPRSLERALSGASCVFLSTHYWEHFNKDKEIHQASLGMNAVDACVQAGVNHIIFHGGENPKRMMDKECGYLESKSAIEEYIMEKCYTMNYTFLRLPFLYENLLSVFKPHFIRPDTYALALPLEDIPIDCMSIADIGKVVYVIMGRPKQYLNKTINLSAEKITIHHMAEVLTKQIEDKRFICPKIRIKDYEQFHFKGASDMAALFEYYQCPKQSGDIKLTRNIYGHPVSFEKWVHENEEQLTEVLKSEE
ncbi:hypothetical protein LOTGIDRAFT_130631 [Lottia gigantea]|uniref:NmrA-like family domain-containing protein 1 n=1 Tax=Lottia gigantea TaxID=225164 RepID=V4B8W9_LOTGI|nr:hypothetical protein LOTGIDRAFT_130631 [Lottia gigantea]ESO85284.1 hypothetical protein LOTGIDRAFT_130631 [Lottia gigantea]